MTAPDFAAAQQRVLERLRLRDAEVSARHEAALQTTRLDRLPYPLNQASRVGGLAWNSIKGREGTRPAFRVGQVDAELLDEELIDLLKGQVGEALKYFGVCLDVVSYQWVCLT
jgi:peroxin-2